MAAEATDRLVRDFFLGFVKLHAIHHAARAPLYGLALLEELQRHGYALGPGTLYPLMHGLREAGYLRREERMVGGKVRKYYIATPAGRKALDEARERLVELVDEVLEGRGPAVVPGPADATTRGSGSVAEDLISPADVRRGLAGERPPLVLDVRGAEEFAVGHLPGARHVPADELEGRLAELPADRPVVTYCSMRHRGSSRSERAAAMLRGRGYDARALDGGLPAWEATGGAVERVR